MGVGEVVEAGDGRAAYEWLVAGGRVRKNRLASRRGFDLIICDWIMPEMTGFELLKKVRAHRKLKNTLFLMLTAENERENITAAAVEGVTDYIVKPFSKDVLEAKIKKLFAEEFE